MHQPQTFRKDQRFRTGVLYEAGLRVGASGQEEARAVPVGIGFGEGSMKVLGPRGVRSLYKIRFLGRSQKCLCRCFQGHGDSGRVLGCRLVEEVGSPGEAGHEDEWGDKEEPGEPMRHGGMVAASHRSSSQQWCRGV